MKKVVVLLAVAVLYAAPSLAAISGTAHDLSGPDAGTNTEVCVYCHTPHGADTGVANAPLWNRTTTTPAASAYVGIDEQNDGDNAGASLALTDAPLCLSCHDGGVADALNNPPNNGTTDLSAYAFTSAEANLSNDLSDDHPIGFNWTSVAADTEIISAQAVLPVDFPGGTGDKMWCSTCHDVHDDTNGQFLRISNAGSALCLTCHDK